MFKKPFPVPTGSTAGHPIVIDKPAKINEAS